MLDGFTSMRRLQTSKMLTSVPVAGVVALQRQLMSHGRQSLSSTRVVCAHTVTRSLLAEATCNGQVYNTDAYRCATLGETDLYLEPRLQTRLGIF